ncbi:MAG: chemotaxis protein CheD [Candidatus Omnitrophota bacterium]
MKATISVVSGEVWAVKQDIILKSDGIGSCVVVAAYDSKNKIGSLSHIMLPGRSIKSEMRYDSKYAYDAIEDMLFKMKRLGAVKGSIEACLVGGGNVLNIKSDTLCDEIINSVVGILDEKGIKVIMKAVGGVLRRSVSLDVGAGAAYYTEGNGNTSVLYKWEN